MKNNSQISPILSDIKTSSKKSYPVEGNTNESPTNYQDDNENFAYKRVSNMTEDRDFRKTSKYLKKELEKSKEAY